MNKFKQVTPYTPNDIYPECRRYIDTDIAAVNAMTREANFYDEYAHILMDVATGDIGYGYLKRLCEREGVNFTKVLKAVNQYKHILRQS